MQNIILLYGYLIPKRFNYLCGASPASPRSMFNEQCIWARMPLLEFNSLSLNTKTVCVSWHVLNDVVRCSRASLAVRFPEALPNLFLFGRENFVFQTIATLKLCYTTSCCSYLSIWYGCHKISMQFVRLQVKVIEQILLEWPHEQCSQWHQSSMFVVPLSR